MLSLVPSAFYTDKSFILCLKQDKPVQNHQASDITYIWNSKYDTNEVIYETETDS